MKRKGISKKLRFEVLKRDDFTCKYCSNNTENGAKLHIDHVVPVAKGGGNEIENLVTACFDCNSGKSDILLDDVTKGRNMKEELEKVRQQKETLEMYYKYTKEKIGLEEKSDKLNMFIEIVGIDPLDVTSDMKRSVKTIIKKFGLETTCRAYNIFREKEIDYNYSYLYAIARNLHMKQYCVAPGLIKKMYDMHITPHDEKGRYKNWFYDNFALIMCYLYNRSFAIGDTKIYLYEADKVKGIIDGYYLEFIKKEVKEKYDSIKETLSYLWKDRLGEDMETLPDIYDEKLFDTILIMNVVLDNTEVDEDRCDFIRNVSERYCCYCPPSKERNVDDQYIDFANNYSKDFIKDIQEDLDNGYLRDGDMVDEYVHFNLSDFNKFKQRCQTT